MKVFVNKKEHEVETGTTLGQLIESLEGIPTQGCAVAINYAVIPKANWHKVVLEENAKILIIKAVSGG